MALLINYGPCKQPLLAAFHYSASASFYQKLPNLRLEHQWQWKNIKNWRNRYAATWWNFDKLDNHLDINLYKKFLKVKFGRDSKVLVRMLLEWTVAQKTLSSSLQNSFSFNDWKQSTWGKQFIWTSTNRNKLLGTRKKHVKHEVQTSLVEETDLKTKTIRIWCSGEVCLSGNGEERGSGESPLGRSAGLLNNKQQFFILLATRNNTAIYPTSFNRRHNLYNVYYQQGPCQGAKVSKCHSVRWVYGVFFWDLPSCLCLDAALFFLPSFEWRICSRVMS